MDKGRSVGRRCTDVPEAKQEAVSGQRSVMDVAMLSAFFFLFLVQLGFFSLFYKLNQTKTPLFFD